MDLHGKCALVTGAARGIGRAIAERIAAAGADVAVADVLAEPLAATAAAVEAAGRRSLAVTADVTDAAAVAAMVERVCDGLGRIDLLFNNAGVIEVEPFLEVDEGHWDRVMTVNAKGAFLVAQAVARRMVAQGGGGRIVNTASVASHIGLPDSAPYAASKAAVLSLTRSMALALAPHRITVNALAPGIVDTDMWDLIDARRATLDGVERGEPIRRRVAQIPLGRAATAADVAEVAAFLACDASAYVTGQTVSIDGGVRPT